MQIAAGIFFLTLDLKVLSAASLGLLFAYNYA